MFKCSNTSVVKQNVRRLGLSSIIVLSVFEEHAAAQQTLPAIDIGAQEQKPAPGPGSDRGMRRGTGGAAGAGATQAAPTLTPQQARPDLQPDNVANSARVAPSSRPHTQTFTRKEIEELNPQDVFGLLSNATSVLVTYQGRKFPNNLRFRGDSNFGFVVDGAYLSAQTAGLMMQTLPISAIDQVDVVRDPSALTLGPLVDFGSASGALNSGFVVIRTHIPQKTEAELRSVVQTYGGVQGSVYGAYVFDDKTGQLPTFISGFIQKSSAQGPANFYAWNDTVAGLLKGGFSSGILETNWTLFQESSRYAFQQATYGQNSTSLTTQKWSYSPMEATFLTSNTTLRWDERNTSLLTLAYTKTEDNNVLRSFTSPTVTVNNEKSYTGQINARHSFAWQGSLAQLGIQYINWSNPTGQTSYAGYARKEDTLSGYGNFEQKLLSERIILDGSVRVDRHFDFVGVDQASLGATTNYFYNRGFPLALNYAAGATVRPLKGLDFDTFDSVEGLSNIAFSGRYSHTEQPDISGIIPDSGVTLLPEKQDKYEAAVVAPVFSWFIPEVTYFDTEIANNKTPSRYITYNGQQTPVWAQANTSRQGIEAVASGVLLNSQFGRTNYRGSYTRITAASTSSSSTPYAMTLPRSQANFSLTQSWNQFSATVAANYVSGFWSNFNSVNGLYWQVGNYLTVDANASYSMPVNGWDAKLSVFGRNITNKRYETILGYPAWGAVWGTELKLTFSGASVADLPSTRTPLRPSTPVPVWTGLYAGLNAGGVFGDNNGLQNVPGDAYDDPGVKGGRPATFFGRASASSASAVVPLNASGFVGGLQLGYNIQFKPQFVAGLEADFQGLTGRASGSTFAASPEPATRTLVFTSTAASKNLAYLGTARGRLGYLATPTLLVYGTGGLAYGEARLSSIVVQAASSPSFALNGGYQTLGSLRVGWTAGAGAEWLFSKNWSAKGEYLYYDLGNEGYYGLFAGANRALAAPRLLYASNVQSTARFSGHGVRAAVNYHFDWIPPLEFTK